MYAKSQFQPTWHHLLPENFPKSKLSIIISGECLCISEMLLNHENLGTDTLLPTPPSESCEYSLGSLTHTNFLCACLRVLCAF